MTLENVGISARLWNTCAKGGERPSRQGAACQRDRVSEKVEEMCRAAEGGIPLHPELLSGVLALWVLRANVCGALTIGSALWSPHSLTFSRGTETRSSITRP